MALDKTHSRWTEESSKSTRREKFHGINSLRSRIVDPLMVRSWVVSMSRSIRRVDFDSVSHGPSVCSH